MLILLIKRHMTPIIFYYYFDATASPATAHCAASQRREVRGSATMPAHLMIAAHGALPQRLTLLMIRHADSDAGAAIRCCCLLFQR
jgi:hypothetical protein